MQIKTAAVLIAGSAVGFFLGCFQPEDTKEKIVSGIKDKIVYALTGEHIRKKEKYATKRTDYNTSPYAKYYEKKKKEEPKKFTYDWENMKKNLFEFKTFDEADKVMQFMKKEIDSYGTVRVTDVGGISGNYALDFALAKYGWDEEDYRNATIAGNRPDPTEENPKVQEKWWIEIERPHALY